MPHNIVIFASGSGSNAEEIVRYFADKVDFQVRAFFTNSPESGVIKRGEKLNIPVIVFTRDDEQSGRLLSQLRGFDPKLIVLAGYLRLIPDSLLRAFPEAIINIHPALLPKFGGKGMYGMNVHRAVVNAGESESGITIHYVDAHYDEGKIIKQVRIAIAFDDTPETVQRKVQELEHYHYARAIEKLLTDAKG